MVNRGYSSRSKLNSLFLTQSLLNQLVNRIVKREKCSNIISTGRKVNEIVPIMVQYSVKVEKFLKATLNQRQASQALQSIAHMEEFLSVHVAGFDAEAQRPSSASPSCRLPSCLRRRCNALCT